MAGNEHSHVKTECIATWAEESEESGTGVWSGGVALEGEGVGGGYLHGGCWALSERAAAAEPSGRGVQLALKSSGNPAAKRHLTQPQAYGDLLLKAAAAKHAVGPLPHTQRHYGTRTAQPGSSVTGIAFDFDHHHDIMRNRARLPRLRCRCRLP